MKKIIGFIFPFLFIAFLLIGLVLNSLLSSELNNEYNFENFNIDYYYLPIIGEYTKPKVLGYVGQRDMNYHFRSGKKFIAFQQSGSVNFAYNFSYLVNTPTKLFNHTFADFKKLKKGNNRGLLPTFERNTVSMKKQEETFMVDGVLLNKEGEPINLEDIETFTSEKKVTKTIIDWGAWALFLIAFTINLTKAFFGAIFACVMLVVGTITGTLFHPILTIKELLPALWASVLSVFIAVKNIFFW